MIVEINCPYHLVFNRSDVKFRGKILTEKKHPVPSFINNVLKQVLFVLPETPGSVVRFLQLLINEQNFFIGELFRRDHPHRQAEPSTTGTTNDEIIF